MYGNENRNEKWRNNEKSEIMKMAKWRSRKAHNGVIMKMKIIMSCHEHDCCYTLLFP
jgi:hypothetical protein